MNFVNRNQLNDIMVNSIVAVRHILTQADHRLAATEQDLAMLRAPYDKDPKIRLRVFRLEDHDQGSLGVLAFDGRLFCFTLEPDSGDPAKPRILAGTYPLSRWNISGSNRYKYKNTLEIVVPGHSAVLFHSGNLEAHSQMCVLIARDPGYLFIKGKKIRAILDSRSIYKKFQKEIVSQIQDGDKVEFRNLYIGA